MRFTTSYWKKKIILFIIILIIILFALFSNYGIIKRYTITSNYNKLIETIKDHKDQIDSLNKRLRILENDNLELERIAREKYGLIKPGENIIYIEKKNNN